MRRKNLFLKHLFSREELEYLVEALSEVFVKGVGPIEKNIPMTHYWPVEKREVATLKQTLLEMEITDSRSVENKMRLSAVIRAAKKAKIQIAFKREPLGTYRFWKIAGPVKQNNREICSQDSPKNNSPGISHPL